MDFKNTTGYGGRPKPESDANYEKLIDGELVGRRRFNPTDALSVGIVSISAEEHQTLLRSSAKDQRAPGRFVVALDVFHQVFSRQSIEGRRG